MRRTRKGSRSQGVSRYVPSPRSAGGSYEFQVPQIVPNRSGFRKYLPRVPVAEVDGWESLMGTWILQESQERSIEPCQHHHHRWWWFQEMGCCWYLY